MLSPGQYFISYSLLRYRRGAVSYPALRGSCCRQPFSQFPRVFLPTLSSSGGGRVVRWSWVNFQCRGVLLIWIIVGQGPTALVVGAGGGCLDVFSLVYHFFFLSPSLWETARYRLKYCLKGPLNPKQPTNQPNLSSLIVLT